MCSRSADIARVDAIVRMAWNQLPPAHRNLLQEIGASQWQVVKEPLGPVVDRLLRSADHPGLPPGNQRSLDGALAVWIVQLRLMLLHGGHRFLQGLDDAAYDDLVSTTAWHEWGHALSTGLCSAQDVAEGPRLLQLAPQGVRESIRKGGYRPNQYTHELVANVYALLMIRRRQDLSERPRWLNEEIYKLVVRVTGWRQ